MIRFRYFLLTVLACLRAFPLDAQNASFTLLDFDLNGYPRLRARFFLTDTAGTPITDLLPVDARLRDNGIEYPALSVSCPAPRPPERLSSVLAVDVSGSMLNGDNIGIARAAANAWIDALPLGYSDCALTSFDHQAYLNRDFTINRAWLSDAIRDLRPIDGGTDYNAGLISNPAGAVRVAATGSHRRVVVFLTDGEGGGDENAIVQAALDNDVTVHAVVLRMRAPELLRNVAERTGGLWFEEVESREQAEAIYRAILRRAQGEESCTLEWEVVPDCTPAHKLEIEFPFHGASWSGSYVLPDPVLPALSVFPFGVAFGPVPPGSFRDTVITMTARNRAVTISSIESGSPHFTVVSGAERLPFILDPGRSRELTIRFAPTDSAFRYGSIVVESDACAGRSIGFTGGLPGLRAPEATLRLKTPNGGERYAVGSDVLIEWEGVLPEDTVSLEYSIDGGSAWTIITDSASGLRHRWIAPPTPSDRCLMSVRQRTAGGESGTVVIPTANRLSAGDFSPDDRFVAVGEYNVTVHDSWTGAQQSQVGATWRPVVSLQFAPDGSTLLVGSGEVRAYLYDWISSQIVGSFGGSTVPTVARLSPDGTRIAAHSFDTDVVIYDAATGAEIRRLTGHWLRGYAIGWSPDGKRIVSGGTDNIAIVWDAETGALEHTLQHGSWVTGAFFSPDGTRIVTSCSDSTVRIWDVATGGLIREIDLPASASSAQFSPDGTKLGITRFDPVVELRDAGTGGLLRRLVGHRRSVLFADWSNDGSRLLTVGWDSTARVWDLARVPDQTDRSDAFWSIVGPRLALLEVDMGRVAVGASADSVVSAWLCNHGTVAMRIDSITFANGRNFGLVSGRPPFILEPGECVDVEFRFAPDRVGTIRDSIVLHAGAYTSAADIRGEGALDPLRVEATVIDFGPVAVGDRRDSLVTVVIRNAGPVAFEVVRTELAGPDRDQFSILSGGGRFSLAPGESRAMELRFSPVRKGKTTGSILFDHETVTNSILGLPPAVVLLNGEGVCPEEVPDRTLSVPAAIEAVAGDHVRIPLLVDGPGDTASSTARRYTVLIRFNRSLLAPLDSASLDVATDEERMLLYDGEWSGESDTLRLLSFLAALGNAGSTPVVIESFVWEDGCDGGLTIIDGEFRLADLCDEGGTRLFLARDSIFLRPVVPNPARDRARIEYGVIEEGRTDLLLMDAAGRSVAVLVSAALPPGRYLLDVDTAELPSGTYHLLLRTPTRIVARSLLIER